MRKLLFLLFSLMAAMYVLYIYLDTKVIPDSNVISYYINNFLNDTWAKNGVTAIYLNYRVFDSIFETLMLLVSVIAVIHFSRREDYE